MVRWLYEAAGYFAGCASGIAVFTEISVNGQVWPFVQWPLSGGLFLCSVLLFHESKRRKEKVSP